MTEAIHGVTESQKVAVSTQIADAMRNVVIELHSSHSITCITAYATQKMCIPLTKSQLLPPTKFFAKYTNAAGKQGKDTCV
jgi:hypothetical protein